MTLGQRITALRQGRKLSQDELAGELGVSRQSVSKWETGQSVPDLERLLQLSEFFNVSLDTLVKGEGPAPATAKAPEAVPAASAPAKVFPLKKAVGLVFLAVGLAGVLILSFRPDGFLVLAAEILLAGILLLAVRRHTALVISGVLLAQYFILGPYVTAFSPYVVFSAAFWREFTVLSLLPLIGWAGLALWVWRLIWIISRHSSPGKDRV